MLVLNLLGSFDGICPSYKILSRMKRRLASDGFLVASNGYAVYGRHSSFGSDLHASDIALPCIDTAR